MTLPSPEIRAHRPADLLGPLNAIEEKNAPDHLFTIGDASLLERGRRVSVVGSRRASVAGLERAQAIAAALLDLGITVVSGLAAGIDAVAHRTALGSSGRTIAVLGTPLDKVYPAEHRALQNEIGRRDLLVSQFPVGYPMGRHLWPQRNRTMALLSDATIIVEAAEKSGTLHQGWEALRLGRPLLIHEAVAADSALSWPEKMLGYGAHRFDLRDLHQLLEEEVAERVRGESLAL